MSHLVVEALALPGLGPVDLEVGAGECVVLAGPSGAGKTRLLRAIADLDPHQGRVSLAGVVCESVAAPEWRRRVGLLRAESCWWRATVREHFCTVGDEGFARLGFDPSILTSPVDRLSSGERQRLALLRLLANRPAVLLLDEPTAHLDAALVGEAEGLLRDYLAATGASAVWVTHDEAQARRVAKRRLLLEAGQLSEHPLA